MSHLNTRRVGKTWWQIACQGWILPQNEVYLSKESLPWYLLDVYSCCKYLLWHSVLMFSCFVCVMPYIVVPAGRVGAEARLQERDRLIYDDIWCQLIQWTVMNNEVMESNVMNTEVSTSVVSDDQMKSRLYTHFLVLWRCLADSVLASSPAGKCEVRKDKT